MKLYGRITHAKTGNISHKILLFLYLSWLHQLEHWASSLSHRQPLSSTQTHCIKIIKLWKFSVTLIHICSFILHYHVIHVFVSISIATSSLDENIKTFTKFEYQYTDMYVICSMYPSHYMYYIGAKSPSLAESHPLF